MAVRKVSNRGGNVIGKFPSLKMRRMIAFESLLERDFIYLLEYDAQVTWYEEQPVTIEYQHVGKTKHYTPDFHLVEQGRDVLVECKPEKFADREETRRKATIARKWRAQHGWEFRIVVDNQVRAGFRLQNIKLLIQYARQKVNPVLKGRIYTVLQESGGQMQMSEIVRTIPVEQGARVENAILYMAFHHQVMVQLDTAPLSKETFICLAMEENR